MPLYDYTCKRCGYKGEHITGFDEYPPCPKCKKKLTREMPFTHGVSMGAAGAYGYYDDNLGCYISTNRQRREVMRKQGVKEKIGKGWY